MTLSLDLQSDIHRRFNPLTGEWLLVSPRRTARPWQGQIESTPIAPAPEYDPQCYLCPGNVRANGTINPAYKSTFVFDNDFPALSPDATAAATEIGGGLLTARGEAGRCRVICYSPFHNLSLGQTSIPGITQVIDTWAAEYQTLGARPRINAVTIFENRGALMGASNPHPHGQIWANQTVPGEVLKESTCQSLYMREHHSCLLCDYALLEIKERERLVCANESFIAVLPFWANWPFETLVLPRAHVRSLDTLVAPGRDAFARILKALTFRYDALFNTAFPYTMGLHQQPTDGGSHSHWHLHAHFFPPLLRSAGVRKFMVGYEMLAECQRDMTPEKAASMLRGDG
jgi:UDPglucose--hexose-1-phosphate uridylyltransferase